MTEPTLLDRLMRWLGLAREKAYRAGEWQEDEAILVSTKTTRAWIVRIDREPAAETADHGFNERLAVTEIDRDTGEPVVKPESYVREPDQGEPTYGYEACWALDLDHNTGGRCRRPRGHDGPHAYS
jgi:hypothetical protein